MSALNAKILATEYSIFIHDNVESQNIPFFCLFMCNNNKHPFPGSTKHTRKQTSVSPSILWLKIETREIPAVWHKMIKT